MNPNSQTPGVVAPSGNSSSKDVLLNFGFFILLVRVVYDLGTIVFAAIDKLFPSTTAYQYYGSYGSYGYSSISWPVSVTIVIFPILLILGWFIEKHYTAVPEERNSKARKFFTYLPLVITSLVLIGNFITVLYRFIDGQDLSIAFLLKSLTVVLISIVLFLYYFFELKGMLQNKGKWVVILSSLMVTLVVILGFMALGSPRTQRQIRADDTRVSHLASIDSQVGSYVEQTGQLPQTLADMKQISGNFPNDPETNAPYEYIAGSRMNDGTYTYQLCATFARSSSATNDMWGHPAGRHCFSRTYKSYTSPAPVVPVNNNYYYYPNTN